MNSDLHGKAILLVDDDPLLLETLAGNLDKEGCAVPVANSGEEALRRLRNGPPVDAVILDWMMPQMSGREVLHTMRAEDIDVPVLILTGLTSQINEESAYIGGAVDFIDKSRSFGILLHRLRMVLAGRRREAAEVPTDGDLPFAADGRKSIGQLTIEPATGRALWRGQVVPLTLTEFQIIHRLTQKVGQDVRYRKLYDVVHGEGFQSGAGPEGSRTNIRSFVKRIRQKFKDLDDGFDEIENYPGLGYRWRSPSDG